MVGDDSSAPHVTVVVATNRGGPFLGEALASVVAQTFEDWDLVVVDDGSPDPADIAAVVEALDDPRARLLRVPAGGVSRARNAGVAAGKGEVLAFLDDDDRWDPRRLELGVVPFSDTAVVATYCGMRTIDRQGRELVPAGQSEVKGRDDLVAGGGSVFAGNLLVRRSAFDDAHGFDPRSRQAEDLDLVLTLAAAGAFVHVVPTLVDYRHHEGNTTRGYRGLAISIRSVLRTHRRAARSAHDAALVAALRTRAQANDRYAAWAALRAARRSWRAGRRRDVLADLGWVVTFAPWAPLLWFKARLARRSGR